MNDLRKGRWSDPGTAINEPEDAWLQEHPLLAKDLRRISPSHSRNVINDYQSLNQRSAL